MSSSACSRDWCVRHYGLDAAKTPVIHMGVDTTLFRPDPAARPSRPTVVFAGRIAASKGADALTAAVCRLSREMPDVQLRLVGRGDARTLEGLRARAAGCGLPDLLEFVGFVPREQLARELVRAHVFAAPSRYEGGPGLVYLEAMACGLPVIACAGNGASEVVIPGTSGILVPPGDVDAIADRHACAQLGERARRFAVETADTAACLDRLEAFYRSVVTRTAASLR
jgi:glycosyltransferase involved in cell wall biosynthesis